VPRVLPQAELERYLELIAALKVRTSNRKGRHLSTSEAIRLLEDYGLHTPEGHVQAPKDVLKTPTVNAYLKGKSSQGPVHRMSRHFVLDFSHVRLLH
jgi:hypothetical protein